LSDSSASRLTRVLGAATITVMLFMPAYLHGGSEAGSELPRPMASPFAVALNVTNTIAIDRPDEVLQMNLTLPDSTITDSTNFSVRRQSDDSEVLSGPLNSTVELYPSGYIHRMRIAFQDSFNASERKGYFIRPGNRTALVGDMGFSIAPPNIYVTDGNATDMRNYRIWIDNSELYYTNSVRVYYNHTTYPYEAQSGILVRVAGDLLVPDQPSIQLGWGVPDSIVVDSNNVMVSTHLVYKSPYWFHWGVGFNLERDTDLLWAVITINVYNNRSVIDEYVSKKVNEKFYNHNGFVMEISALMADDGNYEYIYGTPNHVRQWVRTPALNWTWDQTKLVGLDVGNRSAPSSGDLDGDGDLDMIVGSLAGTLTGFENTGGPSNPTFNVRPGFVPPGGPWNNNTAPVLGDLDGDGDLDLVVGLASGQLIAFRNTGTSATPVWTRDDAMLTGVNSMAMPLFAAPELADVDSDGDLDLLVGKFDGGFDYYRNDGNRFNPAWVKDDATFSYLNQGPTKMPGNFTTPEIVDVEMDGLLDFVSGQNFTTFGSLIYFANTGTNSSPRFTQLKPSVLGTIGSGVWWNKDYTVPEFGDFTGDGFQDIVMGMNDGTLQLYTNTRWGWYERHVNEMQPLQNGSYRFFYDNQGNDGQLVITNYSTGFNGWYVVAQPSANASVFRYMPDFSRYVYRDRYSGQMYPWAGGNVSYYPFLPNEDGYVTRGILIGRAYWTTQYHGYAYGASYMTQTGEAGGYVHVPVTSMNITSHQVLVMELPYDHSAALYDSLAEIMENPLKIEADADLTLSMLDITMDPTDPAENMAVTITANVWNVGFSNTSAVLVEFFNGDPTSGGTRIGFGQVIPAIVAGGRGTASVVWDTAGIFGIKNIFVAVDRAGPIKELDEDNNVASRQFTITREARIWSDEILISQSKHNDMDPAIAVDANGRVWFTWHTFGMYENFDVYATDFDGTSWGKVETIAENYKHTGAPTLAPAPNGDMWLIFSSNKVEYANYIATRHPMWYWAAKYDLYGAVHSYDGWHAPERITDAVDYNESDGAPSAAFAPDGKLWTAYRHTYYALYFRPGMQISNTPFNDENISARSFDGTSWSGQQNVDNRAGNLGWWGGAKVVVSPTGTVWAFYESESGKQFDIYYSTNSGSGWTTPTRLSTNAAQDVRPVVTFDDAGTLWVAWESDRNGNKDIYVRSYDGSTWSPERQLTTDLGEDIKPAIAVNPNGYVFVAWESDRTGNKDIFLKVYNKTGWSPDFQVTTDPHADEEVAIAGGADGAMWLAWESDRNGYGDKDIYVKALTGNAPGPVVPVRGPSDLKAELYGNSLWDVRLTWNLSADDWLYGRVTGYVVRCGNVYDPSGASYSPVVVAPPEYGWAVLQNMGQHSPDNIFCQVLANSTAGLSAPSNQAGAFKIHLTGHDLVSVPLLIRNTSASSVLATATIRPFNFTYVRYYDSADSVDPWKEYTAAGYRDLFLVDNGMGLWAGSSGPSQISVAGVVPSGYPVHLKAGWNLVGYPSMTERRVADALAGLPFVRVEGFDPLATDYNLRVLGPSDLMLPGQGYWVCLLSDATWFVGG